MTSTFGKGGSTPSRKFIAKNWEVGGVSAQLHKSYRKPWWHGNGVAMAQLWCDNPDESVSYGSITWRSFLLACVVLWSNHFSCWLKMGQWWRQLLNFELLILQNPAAGNWRFELRVVLVSLLAAWISSPVDFGTLPRSLPGHNSSNASIFHWFLCLTATRIQYCTTRSTFQSFCRRTHVGNPTKPKSTLSNPQLPPWRYAFLFLCPYKSMHSVKSKDVLDEKSKNDW